MLLVDFFNLLFQIINRLINILKPFATMNVFWIFEVFNFLIKRLQLFSITINILWNRCQIFSVFFDHLLEFTIKITGISENLINFWIRIFSSWWKLIITFFKFFDLLKTRVNCSLSTIYNIIIIISYDLQLPSFCILLICHN